ncbi:MAG: hypothetical protein ACLT8A_13740 [Subdoligranulum sp.]
MCPSSTACSVAETLRHAQLLLLEPNPGLPVVRRGVMSSEIVRDYHKPVMLYAYSVPVPWFAG